MADKHSRRRSPNAALVLVEDYFTDILEEEMGRQISIRGYLDNVCKSFKRLFGLRGQLFKTDAGEWGIAVMDPAQGWRIVAPASDVFELQEMKLDPGDGQAVHFVGVAIGFKRKRVEDDNVNVDSPAFVISVEDHTVEQVAKRQKTAARSSAALGDDEISFPCTLRGLQSSTLADLNAANPKITVQPGGTDLAVIDTALKRSSKDATILRFVATYSGSNGGSVSMFIDQSFRENPIRLTYDPATSSFLPAIECDRKKDDPKKPGPDYLTPLVVELVKVVTVVLVANVLGYLSAFFETPEAIAADQIALNNLALATEDGIEQAAPPAKPELPDYIKGFREQFKIKPPPNAQAVTKAFPNAGAVDLASGLDKAYAELTSSDLTEALWKAKAPPFNITEVGDGLYSVFGTRTGYAVETFVQDLYWKCLTQRP